MGHKPPLTHTHTHAHHSVRWCAVNNWKWPGLKHRRVCLPGIKNNPNTELSVWGVFFVCVCFFCSEQCCLTSFQTLAWVISELMLHSRRILLQTQRKLWFEPDSAASVIRTHQIPAVYEGGDSFMGYSFGGGEFLLTLTYHHNLWHVFILLSARRLLWSPCEVAVNQLAISPFCLSQCCSFL